MKIIETRGNLFSANPEYYLVHCISGDYALGAGIAREFNSKFNMRRKLHIQYPIPKGKNTANVGRALLVENVFNLVTKQHFYEKPLYSTLEATLKDMCRQCDEKHITKLAMPLIGCGLDKLDWLKVKNLVERTFLNSNVEIVVFRFR